MVCAWDFFKYSGIYKNRTKSASRKVTLKLRVYECVWGKEKTLNKIISRKVRKDAKKTKTYFINLNPAKYLQERKEDRKLLEKREKVRIKNSSRKVMQKIRVDVCFWGKEKTLNKIISRKVRKDAKKTKTYFINLNPAKYPQERKEDRKLLEKREEVRIKNSSRKVRKDAKKT